MTEPADPSATASTSHEEAPPLLGSWRRLYMLLLIELGLITLLAYALGRWAA